MTPDADQLIDELHRKVARQRPGGQADVTNGDVLRLINLLRMADRAATVADERTNKLLRKAAEENLEQLLVVPATGTPAGIPVSAAGDKH